MNGKVNSIEMYQNKTMFLKKERKPEARESKTFILSTKKEYKVIRNYSE